MNDIEVIEVIERDEKTPERQGFEAQLEDIFRPGTSRLELKTEQQNVLNFSGGGSIKLEKNPHDQHRLESSNFCCKICDKIFESDYKAYIFPK